MIRHVVDDLYQIGEPVAGRRGFQAVQVYLLQNGDRPILVDCGSHLHRQPLMEALNGLLDGRIPATIFLTHSELPHAGNIAAVVEKWPSIRVIVSNVMLPYIEILPVLPLDQVSQAVPGTTLTLDGRTITFVDALLKDQPGSQWIYDHRTRTLFTGDGFGYVQPTGANRFSDEIPGGIQEAQFRAYHQTAFHFLRWVLPDRFNADLDHLFRRLPVEIIAPIHGPAIRGEIDRHRERLKRAIAAICAEHRGGPAATPGANP